MIWSGKKYYKTVKFHSKIYYVKHSRKYYSQFTEIENYRLDSNTGVSFYFFFYRNTKK